MVPIQPGVVLYVDHFDERGVDLFRVVCESDLEGIWNTNAQESEGFLWGGAAASGCPAVTHHEA